MTINRVSNVPKTIALGVLVTLLTACAATQPRIAQTTSRHPEVTLNTDNPELVNEIIVLEMQIRGASLQADANNQLVFSKQMTGLNAKRAQLATDNQYSTAPDANISFTISKVGRMIRVEAFAQTGNEDVSGNNAWFNILQEILHAVEYDVEKESTTSSAKAKPEASAQNAQRTITYHDGAKYVGGVQDGKPDGTGTFTWRSGARYMGEWSGGRRTGTGTYRWANGDQYDGQWLADKRSGTGTMVYANGASKAGVWRNDAYIGPATNAEPAVASEPKPTQPTESPQP